MTYPRGIRNNNPGNIRHGDKWQGLADKQTDAAFCVFKAPEWGIRALVKILRNYQTKHGLKTVESIINRFAPQIENDTSSYILSVCQVLDVKPRDVIDVFEPGIMINLLKAVIRHENGIQPYSDEVLKKSLELADK
ncbi:MAG: structural protein [Alphaproteobacteria bacterium]|nr:MAG TPA: virion protein [Caudoviricetes sp.]